MSYFLRSYHALCPCPCIFLIHVPCSSCPCPYFVGFEFYNLHITETSWCSFSTLMLAASQKMGNCRWKRNRSACHPGEFCNKMNNIRIDCYNFSFFLFLRNYCYLRDATMSYGKIRTTWKRSKDIVRCPRMEFQVMILPLK